jgi:ATP-dependent DNA helicase RecG
MALRIEDLLRRHEDKTLEFKRDLSSPDRVVATVVAFANASGGTVVIGVEDKSRVVRGVSQATDVEERLANLVADRITPGLLVDIAIVPWRKKNLVTAEVYPSAQRPHFDKTLGPEHGTFVRIGSSNRLADEALRAELARGLGTSFDETPLASASKDDLDPRYAASVLHRASKLSESNLLALRALDRTPSGLRPTVGGYLLFRRGATSELLPDAWVHAGRFAGRDRTRIADTKRLEGRLFELVDGALEFLDRTLDTAIEVASTAAHRELRPIPEAALREAMVNAVVHADYRQRGAPLRVAVYSDRVEIENPGQLLPGLTVADLYAGTSRLRNRMIGRVFAARGYIEQWGSGVKRMVEACEAAGKPVPVIDELPGRIRVTFSFDQVEASALNDREVEILDHLRATPAGISSAQAAGVLGVSDRTARKTLSGLAERGLIVVIGSSANDPQRRYTTRNASG